MDDEVFMSLVEEAIKAMPKGFQKRMENVSVQIQHYPTMTQLKKVGAHGLLFGLYEGIPQTKRSYYGVGGVVPDIITIFKFPLLRVSQNLGELKKNVRSTVMHEIGHHFGMSEEAIRKAEKIRARKNPGVNRG